MPFLARVVLVSSLFASFSVAPAVAQSAPTEASLGKRLSGLREVSDAQRPAETLKLALDIRALPAGLGKLKLADGLTHLATEGDPGREALDATAQTLAQSLAENPLPMKADALRPPSPYGDLAKLVRYEHAKVDSPVLTDDRYTKSLALLMSNDADLANADFTLRDPHNKPVTLSSLRGKIVMVNFWATWCPPCRKEMPDLDLISQRLGSQVVVVSIDLQEEIVKVGSFLATAKYHPIVLMDSDGKVAKRFHVEGIPQTFVFDANGKLVTRSIDMRTRGQFLAMLKEAGLHN